jgi:hypothetical protein
LTRPEQTHWWRLIVVTAAFSLLAPVGGALVALSVAALLVVAGLARPREWVIVLLAGGVALPLLAVLATDPLGAALGAYTVLVAAAFGASALLAPAGLLRQAVRAMLWGVLGTGLLGLALRGTAFWGELHWSVLRQVSNSVRFAVQFRPEAYVVYEPMVRFLGEAFPGLLTLQTLAALGLAWQWHTRFAGRPLGPSLAPFRQFRFGDQWVWGLVVAALVWVVPKLAVLKGVALNLGLVLGVLYFLRGTAIAIALAGAAGLPAWALIVAAVAATLLVVPLLLLVPGLWTLGVFDTWLAFRQRRADRPTPR